MVDFYESHTTNSDRYVALEMPTKQMFYAFSSDTLSSLSSALFSVIYIGIRYLILAETEENSNHQFIVYILIKCDFIIQIYFITNNRIW